MKLKLKAVIISLLFLLVLSGCTELPSPESTIKPPTYDTNTSEIDSDISEFIPDNMTLLAPPNMTSATHYIDFDNDQNVEILVFYGSPYTNKCAGVFILDKQDDTWEKIWELSHMSDTYITASKLVDITEDGIEEIVIQISVSDDLSTINIYTYEDMPEILYAIDGTTLEILETNTNYTDSPLIIAIWDIALPYYYENYQINIIQWENGRLVSAIKDNSKYFEAHIDTAYQNWENFRDVIICKYYLAQILINADHLDEATYIIDKYLNEQGLSNNQLAMGLITKGKILVAYEDYEEALIELTKVVESDILSDGPIEDQLTFYLLCDEIYYNLGDYDKGTTMLAQASSLSLFFTTTDYRYGYWQNAIEDAMAKYE